MSDIHNSFRVYQLDFEEIVQKERLVPQHTSSPLNIYLESMPLNGEERSQAIDDLVKLFPEGILTREGENALILNYSSWKLKQGWLKAIKSIVSKMDEKDVANSYGLSDSLVRCIKNPLDTKFRFCIQDLPFCWTPNPSCEFLRALLCMRKGDRIYVGSVLEYG